MTAPETKRGAFPETVTLCEPVAALELDQTPNPAQVLADLYRRCSPNGGCPYSLDQLLRVLSALRYHGRAEAGELATDARLPASATYGCLLEAEDYGLARWTPEPVLKADYVTAEITGAGSRFLREIKAGGRNAL